MVGKVIGFCGRPGGKLTQLPVERLLKDGCRVVVLDDFSTGRPENLAQMRHYSQLHVHDVDVVAYGAIAEKLFAQGLSLPSHPR